MVNLITAHIYKKNAKDKNKNDWGYLKAFNCHYFHFPKCKKIQSWKNSWSSNNSRHYKTHKKSFLHKSTHPLQAALHPSSNSSCRKNWKKNKADQVLWTCVLKYFPFQMTDGNRNLSLVLRKYCICFKSDTRQNCFKGFGTFFSHRRQNITQLVFIRIVSYPNSVHMSTHFHSKYFSKEFSCLGSVANFEHKM